MRPLDHNRKCTKKTFALSITMKRLTEMHLMDFLLLPRFGRFLLSNEEKKRRKLGKKYCQLKKKRHLQCFRAQISEQNRTKRKERNKKKNVRAQAFKGMCHS